MSYWFVTGAAVGISSALMLSRTLPSGYRFSRLQTRSESTLFQYLCGLTTRYGGYMFICRNIGFLGLRDNAHVPWQSIHLSRHFIAFPRLGSVVPALVIDVPGFGSDVPALGNDVTALGNDVTALGNDVTALGNYVTALGNDVTALGNGVPALVMHMVWSGSSMFSVTASS
jgi:hypothetical protein